MDIVVRGDDCRVVLSDGVTIGRGCNMVVMGKNTIIRIGEDSMIADDVDIWATDSHPICDMSTGRVLNNSKSVILGTHVWVGKHARILKGTQIGNGSIVGMASVVAKDVPEYCSAAGNPMRVVKSHVTWKREHIRD